MEKIAMLPAVFFLLLFFSPGLIYAEADVEDQLVDSAEQLEQPDVNNQDMEDEQTQVTNADEDEDLSQNIQQNADEDSQTVEEVPQVQPFVDLSNNPGTYSGDQSISIERSTRSSKGGSSSAQKNVDSSTLQDNAIAECDPVISLKVNQEKRFDVLKKLAEKYNFDIAMREEENTPITIEKHQSLSKVVESITRDMNVVLNYEQIGSCNHLRGIAVLNDKEWSGSGSDIRSFSGGSSRLKSAIKGLSGYDEWAEKKANEEQGALNYRSHEIQIVKRKPEDDGLPSLEKQEAEEKQIDEYRKRVERNGGELLNDELPNGSQLHNAFSVRGNHWKYPKEEIDDMDQYVKEVLSGERVPNIRAMSIDQRAEYMRLRRKYQTQDQENQ